MKDHLTLPCTSFAIYVLNGFLEFIGCSVFATNMLSFIWMILISAYVSPRWCAGVSR